MRNRLSVIVAVTAAVCAVVVASALAAGGKGGQLYVFGGELTVAPGPGATAVSVQVETGNRPALRALIGAQQTQSFSLDSRTEVLVWSNGVPKVGSTADLQAGDDVIVRIRAPRGSSSQTTGRTRTAPAGRCGSSSAPSRDRSPAGTSPCT